LEHRQIMTDFSSPQICSKPYESRPRSVTKPSLLPTLKPEDPIKLGGSNMIRRFCTALISYCLIAAGAAAAADPDATASPPTAAADAGTLQEVVVTARR